MTIDGELTVRLGWDGRRVREVAIASSRPFAIARVLAGRTPDEAAAIVPRLYSLCAGAQGAAAATALDAAGARAPDPQRVAARETAALLEIVQEHFWRLLLDWPKAMGRDGATAPVAAARRMIAPSAGASLARLAAELEQLAAEHVYGMPPPAWLDFAEATALARWTAAGKTLPARLLAELYDEAPDLGASDVALMPPATPDLLQMGVVAALQHNAAFARAPEWDGVPVETGPLARRQAHPLIHALRERDGNTAATRMVARLVDLALVLGQLAAGIPPTRTARAVRGLALGIGEGLATAETARGLLLHRALLADGKVAAYDIVAPTEWNFHPRGALAQGLGRLTASDEGALVRAARIAVQALDPCVACRVEVADA